MTPRYNVNPRYTCGSPAMVSGEQFERVARQEKEAYAEALGGHDPAEKLKAQHLGLDGIAEIVTEQRTHFRVRDWITGKESRRPFHGDTLEALDARERHNEEMEALRKALNAAGFNSDGLVYILVERVFRLEHPGETFTPTRVANWLIECQEQAVLKVQELDR